MYVHLRGQVAVPSNFNFGVSVCQMLNRCLTHRPHNSPLHTAGYNKSSYGPTTPAFKGST